MAPPAPPIDADPSTSGLAVAEKQIVLLSGLAGAGKTTAARALEDLGFFVVDNLPPQLIETLIHLADTAGGGGGDGVKRLAFVADAREQAFLQGFPETWARLRASGHKLLLVFLECTDDVLVKRFQETRRRHPLDVAEESGKVQRSGGGGGGAGILAAIQQERRLLDEVKALADHIIDTGALSVHDLKRLVIERFGDVSPGLAVTVTSFGFKHGLPVDLDMCFDARFLLNPYFVEELRPQTGLDEPVRRYVLAQPDAAPYLDRIVDLVAFLIPRFAAEGKSYATVAIGCTGGRHRSPALTEEVVKRLQGAGFDVRARHRDVERT
jgi:RNase adapter protein RapZ